jgi:SAM-dependent methyltransferase
MPEGPKLDEPKFGERAAQWLAAIYQSREVVAQRAEVLDALALGHGEQVLDIGSGPGLLAAELGHAVGPKGWVEGIDSSVPMVEAARARCEGLPWVGFRQADAAELPFEDQAFDAAAATQVYEYVPAIERALAELNRVLRPGGRAVILDTDWDSAVWQTADRPRMARVLAAWEEHFVHPHLPGRLGPLLRRAGFALARLAVVPLLNPDYGADGYSAGMIGVISDFVAGRCGVSRAEASDWANELRARGADGTYFFSLNRYLFLARKPG